MSAARSRCSREPRRSPARSSPSMGGATCRSNIPSRMCRRSERLGASIMPPPGQRCIVVDDLRLAVFIGVHEHEKQSRQEVSITLHMFVADDAAASRSDDLADHVSYSDVVAKLKER